jgi:hypothetical protein
MEFWFWLRFSFRRCVFVAGCSYSCVFGRLSGCRLACMRAGVRVCVLGCSIFAIRFSVLSRWSRRLVDVINRLLVRRCLGLRQLTLVNSADRTRRRRCRWRKKKFRRTTSNLDNNWSLGRARAPFAGRCLRGARGARQVVAWPAGLRCHLGISAGSVPRPPLRAGPTTSGR